LTRLVIFHSSRRQPTNEGKKQANKQTKTSDVVKIILKLIQNTKGNHALDEHFKAVNFIIKKIHFFYQFQLLEYNSY
jgi:hypothetical protein